MRQMIVGVPVAAIKAASLDPRCRRYFFVSSNCPTFCSRPLTPLAIMPRTPGSSMSIITAESCTLTTPETV